MKKKFKVSEELAPYLIQHLSELKISYRIEKGSDALFCHTMLSGNQFHKATTEAMCLKQQIECCPEIPVITYETAMSGARNIRKKLNGKHMFFLLDKDKKRYYEAVGIKNICK